MYFKNITSGPYPFSGYTSNKVTAVSNTIAVTPNEPTQGHLTFTNVTGYVIHTRNLPPGSLATSSFFSSMLSAE